MSIYNNIDWKTDMIDRLTYTRDAVILRCFIVEIDVVYACILYSVKYRQTEIERANYVNFN